VVVRAYKKFGLKKKVAETGGVDADVGTLLVDVLGGSSSIALLSVGGGSSGLVVELVVRVVDEILLGRHFGDVLMGRAAKGTSREQRRYAGRCAKYANAKPGDTVRWIDEVGRLRAEMVRWWWWGGKVKLSGDGGRRKRKGGRIRGPT